MGKKRGYSLEQSEQAEGQEAMIPPVVRSRRERAVRVRLRNEHGGPSSHTDSGSGDHYSPVNVTDTARSAVSQNSFHSQRSRASLIPYQLILSSDQSRYPFFRSNCKAEIIGRES